MSQVLIHYTISINLNNQPSEKLIGFWPCEGEESGIAGERESKNKFCHHYKYKTVLP